MNQQNTTIKMSGVTSGLLFILAFFTMPIMSGCNGGEIIEAAADSGDAGDIFLIIIMILVLLCAAIGALMFLQDKYRQGSMAGMLGIAGIALALIIQQANPFDLQMGGWLCVLTLLVMSIAPKLGTSTTSSASSSPQKE